MLQLWNLRTFEGEKNSKLVKIEIFSFRPNMLEDCMSASGQNWYCNHIQRTAQPGYLWAATSVLKLEFLDGLPFSVI